jgi:hypothetical protein
LANNLSSNTWRLLLCAVGALLFIPFLGEAHLFDWDEINFAEAAREMLVTGNYSYVQINFKPFWEKPPLFIWMQVLSMSAFGVNEFAARLPNAICEILTTLLLFNIGNQLVSKNFGLLWVLVYLGSFLPQFYFRTGIIDPWFNLFIFFGVWQLVKASKTRELGRKHLLLSSVAIGLAVLTKGPVAFLILTASAGVYFILKFKSHQWKPSDFILYTLIVLLVGFSFFFIEIVNGRGYIVQDFIDYHIRLITESEAGHGQPFYYHFLVLLIGCFPMSWFFVASYFKRNEIKWNHELLWMHIMFWIVLIGFSLVRTKIIHYSSLTYFPMSFVVAHYIHQLIKGHRQLPKVIPNVLLIISVILGSAFVLLGLLDQIKEPLLSLLKANPFGFACFSQEIPDGTFDPFIGLLFITGTLTGIYFILSKKLVAGVLLFFTTTLITTTLLTLFIAPKMELYMQGAIIQFYQDHAKTHHFRPLAMRSYAHLYYGESVELNHQSDDDLTWMARSSDLDRPVYFVTRVGQEAQVYKYFPEMNQVARPGGYVVFERGDKNYPFLKKD